MILHLSTFHLEGGAGVAATRLHRALLRSGEDSRMLVNSLSVPEEGIVPLADRDWQSKLAFARFVGERLYFYPSEKDKSVRFAYSPAVVGANISGHPLVKEADIIHFHWINFGFLSLKSLEKIFALGKPIVWTMHDMWTFTGGCHYSRDCARFLDHCQYCPYLAKPDEYDLSFSQFETKTALYGSASLSLVSPSNWLRQLSEKASLTKHLTSVCIPNCLDTDIFKPMNKSEARKSLGLPAEKNLILFAGANTQDVRKGFTFFEQAMRDSSFSSTVEVIIFGKASSGSFENFPVPVHYMGKISDTARMVEVYNAADMIVVPSLEDNLPNTIMEAMACGTPAVGFETGGIPEMIDHAINGYVAQLKSAESLAKGIKWIIAHNTLGQISQKARIKVEEQYTEKVVAKQYSDLYNMLLSKENHIPSYPEK